MNTARAVCAGVGAALLAIGCALAGNEVDVRQKDRAFNPRTLDIPRGGVVRVINDDGELLHHAYVKSDVFNFDSGEQEPGSSTDIRFTESGTFAVLCAIHPKMRLTVTVH